MAKLIVGAAVFFFGFVSISLPLHAQSVTLNICNTGKVDLDAIFSGGGQVLDSRIRPRTCAAVAKSEGGGMEPGYLGLAFTDSRGQYGAARRFASPNTLTLADGSRTVQRRNVSVPLQLLFQPDFPVCEKVPTGGGAVFGNTTIVEVTNVCEDLGYTLLVETHLDSHEISLEFESISGVLSLNNRRVTFSEKPEIDWAGEEAKRKAHEQPVPVKWSDLLSVLRNPRYQQGLGDVLPGYFFVRGTVAGVEVVQRSVGPTTNITVAQITFRESPAVPHWRPGTRPIPEFNVCTERIDILQEKFGADFRTSMIGKTVEVHGLQNFGGCYGQRASFQIYLERQIRPVPSAVFAADARVWVPPAAPPPPRLLTIDELAGNIVEAALKSSYQDNHQKLDAACTDQTNKAHKANPANFEAINKEHMACLAAIDGKMAAMPAPQRSAEKAKPCAQQLLKAYPDGDRIDPHGFQNGLRACVQAYLGNPARVGTPAAAPTLPVAPTVAPTPAANTNAPGSSGTSTLPAQAQKEPIAVRNPDGTMTFQKPAAEGQEGKGLVIPPQVVIPVVGRTPAPDNASAEAARAKAVQEQQEQQARAAQERAAEQQRTAQEAQQRNQKGQACMEQAAKDHSEGRYDPQRFQEAMIACLQPRQAAQPAQPSK